MLVELAAANNILQIDPVKFVFGLIALVVVYLFVVRKAVPKVMQVLDERHDAIEGGIERAQKAEA